MQVEGCKLVVYGATIPGYGMALPARFNQATRTGKSMKSGIIIDRAWKRVATKNEWLSWEAIPAYSI